MSTPKGGDTRTTTAQTTLPDWLTGAQQNLISTGQSLTSPFTGSPPTQPIAPINSDQRYAIDRIRDEAVINQNSRALPVATTNVTSNPVTSGDIQALMPGYMQSVIDPAVAGIRREGANRDAAIGARYAAGSSFGGSGEALARGQNARSTGESIANTVGTLMAQGYSQAQAVAMANAQRATEASRSNATNSLQADGLRNQFENDDQARDLRILNALMQTGQQQQTQDQRTADLPYTMLDRLRGVVSGIGQTESTRTETSPNTAPSPLQSILGLAGTLGGAALGGPMGASIGGSLFGGLGAGSIGGSISSPMTGASSYSIGYGGQNVPVYGRPF